MKRTLILASVLAFTMSAALANPQPPCLPEGDCPKPPMHQGKMMPPPPEAKKMKDKRAEFDKKLQLTEEQKAKAKEIRMNGHKEMKPIMEQMKAKKIQIDQIAKSNISEEEKVQKIAPIKEELKTLRNQAKDLRIKNTQEFEAILTAKQKKTLEKMKKEAKKNFKKQHPKRPPCNCPPDCKCRK